MARETILRIRTFSEFKNKFIGNPPLVYDSPRVIYDTLSAGEIITHYSGINDTGGKLIYEGDIIKLTGKREPYIGVVCMKRVGNGVNEKTFFLKPAWKYFEGTEYFIDIDTPTRGEKRIRGLFHRNDYPINQENGTGFSDGTVSCVIGNIFQNKDLIPNEYRYTDNNNILR